MVADDRQLELGDILEEVLPHEPSGDGVGPSHRLDTGLRPVSTFFGFRCRYQSGTPKHCEVCRVLIAGGYGECIHCRIAGVIAKNLRDDVQKHPLTVTTWPVGE